MTRDKFLQIPLFLHFADNSRRPDQGEEYDRLWKIRTVFVTLNQAYSKFYSPSEHLTVDEVIVKFQGWVIFRQYIPKKRKRFDIKIYKLCDDQGIRTTWKCTWVDSHSATDDMTATHATVRHLTCRVEGLGHKLFMDNFFSSPRLSDDLLRWKIHSCGTVGPNRKDMPTDFGPKNTEIDKGRYKGEDQGKFDCVSLEGQTRCLHAN